MKQNNFLIGLVGAVLLLISFFATYHATHLYGANVNYPAGVTVWLSLFSIVTGIGGTIIVGFVIGVTVADRFE